MVQRCLFVSLTLVVLLLLATPLTARADEPPATQSAAEDRLPFMTNNQPDNAEQAPSAAGLLVRTLGALVLILGLIVAVAWGLKRFAGGRFGSPGEDAPQLAVLNSLSLGAKRSLAIVRFGERTLLLGSTPQAITLLAEENAADIPVHVRSVADILDDTDTEQFASELTAATDRLDAFEAPEKGSWA